MFLPQLRKVAACEAALERVVLEADEALGSYGQVGRPTSDQARSTVVPHVLVPLEVSLRVVPCAIVGMYFVLIFVHIGL